MLLLPAQHQLHLCTLFARFLGCKGRGMLKALSGRNLSTRSQPVVATGYIPRPYRVHRRAFFYDMSETVCFSMHPGSPSLGQKLRLRGTTSANRSSCEILAAMNEPVPD